MIAVHKIFFEHGNNIFLIDEATKKEITYAEFAHIVLHLADQLQELGIKRGDRLAIFLPNGLDVLRFYYACLVLGVIIVPVNLKFSDQDKQYILECSKANYAVGDRHKTHGVKNISHWPGKMLLVDELPFPKMNTFVPPKDTGTFARFDIDLEEAFSLTFTSGTTGKPKGIFHSAGNLLANAHAFNDAVHVTARHRFLHAMPITYMAGLLNCLLCPFVAGASVVICREFDISLAIAFWDVVQSHNVTCLWAAPASIDMILKMDRGTKGEAYAPGNMHFVAACTSHLPEHVRADFQNRYRIPVLASYGLSETLINTIDRLDAPSEPGTTGRPLPQVTFEARDATGQTLRPGSENELFVHTPNLMLGYLALETGLPERPTRDGWFPTGDIGLLVPDGSLRITDRVKDLIVRGGVNISPRKVEEVLMDHPDVVEAAVVGLPDVLRGEKVVAALRLKERTALVDVKPELTALLHERLEPMAYPEILHPMEKFPKTSTGKVNKRQLRAMLQKVYGDNGNGAGNP